MCIYQYNSGGWSHGRYLQINLGLGICRSGNKAQRRFQSQSAAGRYPVSGNKVGALNSESQIIRGAWLAFPREDEYMYIHLTTFDFSGTSLEIHLYVVSCPAGVPQSSKVAAHRRINCILCFFNEWQKKSLGRRTPRTFPTETIGQKPRAINRLGTNREFGLNQNRRLTCC